MRRPLVVTLRPREPVDHALRRFRRAVDESGVLADLKRHRFHQTESERRRAKRKHSKRAAS